MNGRKLQIALRQPGKSPTRSLAVWASCLRRGLSILIVLFLLVTVAKVHMDASDVPSRFPSNVGQQANAIGAQLLGVRSSSQLEYSRVVIDLSSDVRYKVGHLSNPERLYFDLQQTEISPKLNSRQIDLSDGVVNRIRIGTDKGSVTRLVLDLHSAVRYRISKLNDPVRMLIELSRPPEGSVLVESIPLSTDAPGQTQTGEGPKSNGAVPAGRAVPPLLPEGDVPPGSPSGPQTYGNGEIGSLNYAGAPSPHNLLLLGLNIGNTYDDNVFGNNEQRVGDVNFLIGPSLNLRREGNRLSLGLSYQPRFRIYRGASELNTLDQGLGIDASYRVSSRFSLRARTSATYTRGIFQPLQNEAFLPGLGSSSSLNQTVYTPVARQLAISSRVDASYQANPHDSFSIYFGESRLDFKEQISSAGNLQNTREKDAGLLYQRRLSPHTTVGINYGFQGIDFGPDSRTLVHSAFFSYAQQFSPSVTITVFGGPQHSHLNELVLVPLGPSTLSVPIDEAKWNWAIGGTLTKRVDKTAFQLTAQRQVTNGGGLIGAVVSNSFGASVRRQLPGRWDAIWSGNYAKNSSLGSGVQASSYQSETAGFGLERSFTEKVRLRLGYDFLHQRGSGQSPLLGDLDRDLVSVQFSYTFHQIRLGQQ